MAVPTFLKLALVPLLFSLVPLLVRREYPVVAPEQALVLVTGTSSGLGRDVVRHLHKQGYAVLATVRKESDAQSLIDEFGADSRVRPFIMDITNADHRASVAQAFEDVAKEFGVKPYALINNAGGTKTNMAFQITEESLDWNMELLVKAPVLLTNAIAPTLIAQKAGRILFVGSTGDHLPMPFMSQYLMGKSAIHAFSSVLRNELAFHDIGVTHIYQGPAQSKFFEKNIDTNKPGSCAMKFDDPEEQEYYCKASDKFFGDFENMPTEGEMGFSMIDSNFQTKRWADHLGTPYPAAELYTNFLGRVMVTVSSILPTWIPEVMLGI